MEFHEGAKVVVNAGENLPGGNFIGFIHGGPDASGKYTIDVGDKKVEAGYREPGPGEALEGGCFRKPHGA